MLSASYHPTAANLLTRTIVFNIIIVCCVLSLKLGRLATSRVASRTASDNES